MDAVSAGVDAGSLGLDTREENGKSQGLIRDAGPGGVAVGAETGRALIKGVEVDIAVVAARLVGAIPDAIGNVDPNWGEGKDVDPDSEGGREVGPVVEADPEPAAAVGLPCSCPRPEMMISWMWISLGRPPDSAEGERE